MIVDEVGDWGGIGCIYCLVFFLNFYFWGSVLGGYF